MENKAKNLIPDFKNISGRSLMVYTFFDKEEVIHYQLQMLANNSIPGVLKADTIGLDGEIRLQYEITSLVPVKKLLERRKMSRNDVLTLINQIVSMLESLEQYLLDADLIVFDSTYIYVDPQDMKLGFVYLPLINMEWNPDSLKSFLINLIINDIRFADEPSDDFLQRLIELLKNEDFKLSSLKTYIKDMDRVKPMPIMNAPPVNTQSVIEEKELIHSLIKPQIKDVIKTTKMCYPIKSYIIMGSAVGALILFCLVLVISGIMSPSNPDSLMSLFGFLMIDGAVAYLVYTKVFTPDKKVEKIVLPQKVEYVNKAFPVPVPPLIKQEVNPSKQGFPLIAKIAKSEAAPAETMGQGDKNIAPDFGRKAIEPKKPVLTSPIPQYKDRTVILDSGSLKLPHLKRKQGNNIETIILKNFPFMLGRLEGQVDYCLNNPAIGKLHAEIKNTPEGFFISDMNSLNGTFVNDERVQTGKDSIIKNGDRIILSNEEFVFMSE